MSSEARSTSTDPLLQAPAGFRLRRGEHPRLASLALWFLNFSSWEYTHSIYLEDPFVHPEYRKSGLEKLLLSSSDPRGALVRDGWSCTPRNSCPADGGESSR